MLETRFRNPALRHPTLPDAAPRARETPSPARASAPTAPLSAGEAKKWASRAFTAGNLTWLIPSIATLTPSGIACSLLFAGVGLCYEHTEKRPWMFALAGGAIIAAEAIMCASASGPGALMQELATILPAAQGALMIRKAWTHSRGTFEAKTWMGKPFEWIDAHPLISGVLLNVPSMLAYGAGAAMDGKVALPCAISAWLAGHGLLAYSELAPGDAPIAK